MCSFIPYTTLLIQINYEGAGELLELQFPKTMDKEQERAHKPDLRQDYVQEPNLGI